MIRPQLFTIVFFALLALLLYQIGLILQPFLFPALWAGLLAHWVFPLHRRLTLVVGGRDALAAGCLTFGVLTVVVVPLVWMSALLVGEAGAVDQAVREWIAAGGLQQLPERVAAVPLIGKGLRSLVTADRMQALSMEDSVMAGAKWLSQFLVSQVGDVLKNAVVLVSNFFIMLLVLFFLLKDGERWLAGLYALIPMDESHKRKIVTRLDQTVRAVVKGMLVTAMVQGVLAGLAYLVLAVPFPVVLTALTIVLAPIPFGGTALVWGPVVLYLLWIGAVGKALGMLVWGVGVVSMVDQFLRPWLIGQEVQIPVLLLVLSVLGGLALYGLIGLFVGPIIISLFMTAVQIYREEYYAPAPVASTNPPSPV
ncbi:MAG: AI-2E family transporter [Nitrospira sp.]|jgi:predicted PurR-regulated permease PerM|nr:AI-2E family transporter [Nitrospira sp.]